MSENNESIDELRARLAGLTGPARAEPLSRLAQRLLNQMTSAPVGSPATWAYLDEAIAYQEELYGYFRTGDPHRPQVGALLGYMLAFRASRDRDSSKRTRAISLLDEALTGGTFAAPYLSVLRVLLATMLIQNSEYRLTEMMSVSPMDMLAGRRSPDAVPEIDRAEELLLITRGTTGISADISDMAEMMLQMCELFRSMVGIGTKPMDLAGMQSMMARLAEIQRRYSGPDAGMFGMMRKALEPGAGILGTPGEEVPVFILEDGTEESADAPSEPVAFTPPQSPQPTQADLLRSLVELLSLGRDGRSPWDAVAGLLLPDADVPDLDTVDNAVALASEVLESEATELSEEDIALTHFIYAAAMCLRERADSDGDGTDYEFGAQALLSAARALPADHPGAPAVLRSLGTFLTQERPLAVLDGLAAGFTGRLDAVLATATLPADRAAELHALRCACRAAYAAAELTKAVAALPADYPWPMSLKAAAQLLG